MKYLKILISVGLLALAIFAPVFLNKIEIADRTRDLIRANIAFYIVSGLYLFGLFMGTVWMGIASAKMDIGGKKFIAEGFVFLIFSIVMTIEGFRIPFNAGYAKGLYVVPALLSLTIIFCIIAIVRPMLNMKYQYFTTGTITSAELNRNPNVGPVNAYVIYYKYQDNNMQERTGKDFVAKVVYDYLMDNNTVSIICYKKQSRINCKEIYDNLKVTRF